jgi:hypothetical protein
MRIRLVAAVAALLDNFDDGRELSPRLKLPID